MVYDEMMNFPELIAHQYALEWDYSAKQLVGGEGEAFLELRESLMGTILCFDPGDTTGMAVFRKLDVVDVDELSTKTLEEAVDRFSILIEYHDPSYIVIENYRVYGWKRNEHVLTELHTPKLVGILQAMSYSKDIPYKLQMAREAKNFCNDQRLTEWGFYAEGQRHGRDAIRHGAHFLLFNLRHCKPICK